MSLYRGETAYLSNEDFLDGYGLRGDLLAFSANLYTDTYYIPGNYFLFSDGSKAVITKVVRKDNICYTTVNAGMKLDREKNGSLSEIKLFDASGKELPKGIFSEYPSQIGLQGRAFRILARVFPYESAVTWFHLLTAAAMALVAVVILFLLNQEIWYRNGGGLGRGFSAVSMDSTVCKESLLGGIYLVFANVIWIVMFSLCG